LIWTGLIFALTKIEIEMIFQAARMEYRINRLLAGDKNKETRRVEK
jgi:hypothetical protein